MNNFDYYLINLLSENLDILSQIYFFKINKYLFHNFFKKNINKFRKFCIISKGLCIQCNGKTGPCDYFIYLCDCSNNYPKEHRECSLLENSKINKFNNTQIHKCPLCNTQCMIFLKEAKFINMI